MPARTTRRSTFGQRLRRFLRALVLAPLMLLTTFYGICTLALLLYLVVPPPTTGVHLQRRVESFFEEAPYAKRYDPVRRSRIAAPLAHAVVAAEDTRFYEHGGIDWQAIEQAMEDNQRRRRARGGSTITQQLVKNLFFTTHPSYLRKALEVPLVYLAELILPKERILTLYLNVVEWDRGVYGAEAAARHYYGVAAADLSRYQAASLAAVLPAPRSRTPQRMGGYTNTILTRMRQMGY